MSGAPTRRSSRSMQTPADSADAGSRTSRAPDVTPVLRLRFAYDGYLSSAEALYAQRANAREIASNVGRQTGVFAERMASLRRELSALDERLATENELKAEKQRLTGQIEVLRMINTNATFDGEDKKAVVLFADSASKVIVKHFHEISSDDLSTANKIMDEIIESLKSFDCQSKIDVRNKLKDLLIQVAILTTELNKLKSKCEDIFKEEESSQNHNLSLKILKTQLEDLEMPLFPKKTNLVEEFDKILDALEF